MHRFADYVIMTKPVKGILIIVCIAGLAGLLAMSLVRKEHRDIVSIDPSIRQKTILHNKHAVDTAVSLLRSGYLVLRMGTGADSRLLADLNQKNKSYSHCGIVMMEHGYPFVYHSIGGEDNPDERLRRDSASFFFSPLHNFGIAIVQYDFSEINLGKLKAVVREYYAARPKFDMKFDLKSDDRLYCAEFVYKAVNKAMRDSQYIKTTSALGYTFVGTDDLYINPHAHIVWQTTFK